MWHGTWDPFFGTQLALVLLTDGFPALKYLCLSVGHWRTVSHVRKTFLPPRQSAVVPLHEVLSQLEWAEGIHLDALTFLVVDRGAVDGVRVMGAPEVVGRDKSYLHLEGGGRVPYHRVLEVRSGERVVWARRRGGEGEAGDPQ